MPTIKTLKEINFGVLYYYKLNNNGVFCLQNNTSSSIPELCDITSILTKLNINYVVDSKFNIEVKIDDSKGSLEG